MALSKRTKIVKSLDEPQKGSVKAASLWLRLLGVSGLLIGLFGFTAIVSYHPSDPSPLHATSEPIANITGKYGAALADLMFQTLGYASLVLLLFLFDSCLRAVRGKHDNWLAWRLNALPLVVLSLAVCLSSYSVEDIFDDEWHYRFGGFIGYYLYSSVVLEIGRRTILYSSLATTIAGLWFLFPWLSLRNLYIITLSIIRYFRVALRKRQEGYRGDEWKLRHDESDVAEVGVAIEEEGRSFLGKFASALTCLSKSNQGHSLEEDADIVRRSRGMMGLKMGKAKRLAPSIDKPIIQNMTDEGEEYKLPIPAMLNPYHAMARKHPITEEELRHNVDCLARVLKDFGIRGEIVGVHPGPVVTLFELEPAAGTKSSRVIGLADDIARSMSAVSARIAVVPGRNAMGIELPNRFRETVYLRELLESPEYYNTPHRLPLVLGKSISGALVVADLSRMPHLLVAGTTGSGKSVAINTMILSLLYKYTPKQCRLVLIDPKMLELAMYDGIPHLLAPVVTEAKKAVITLKWVVREMESRYRAMSVLSVRNIHSYNKVLAEAQEKKEALERQVQVGFDEESGQPVFESIIVNKEPLPYIVVVVDEMADLMLVAGKEIEAYIQRLAQMARAAGIHLIMATQRPSVDVITGVIKANFPTRISFQVTSKIDSRTILGEPGAEQLLGAGDMLYMMPGGKIERVHGPFVDDDEVAAIVAFLKKQGAPKYAEDIMEEDEASAAGYGADDGAANRSGSGSEEELYKQAISIVRRDKKATTSYLQRTLRVGYNRAATLIERMEKEGIVGPANHVGKREVLE